MPRRIMHAELAVLLADKSSLLENMILLSLAVPDSEQEAAQEAISEYAAGAFPENECVIRNAITRIEKSADRGSRIKR